MNLPVALTRSSTLFVALCMLQCVKICLCLFVHLLSSIISMSLQIFLFVLAALSQLLVVLFISFIFPFFFPCTTHCVLQAIPISQQARGSAVCFVVASFDLSFLRCLLTVKHLAGVLVFVIIKLVQITSLVLDFLQGIARFACG